MVKSGKYIFARKSNIVIASVVDFVGYSLQKLGLAFRQKKVDVSGLNPKKILILALDHLGDVIFTTPAVRALRKLFPDVHISIMVGSWAVDIYRSSPWVDEVLVFDAPWFAERHRRRTFSSLRDEARGLVKEDFDLGIDLRGDFRHLLMMYLAKIPVRVGYPVTGGGFLLSLSPPFPWDEHAVRRGLGLVKALGAQEVDDKLEVFVSPDDKAYINDLLEEEGISDEDLLVGIHPGAGSKLKRWPSDRFAQVSDKLTRESGAKILITGNSGEVGLAKAVAGSMSSQTTVMAGKTTLGQLAALLSRLSLFISADTGPLHLAVAVGTPVVAIYSGTNDPKIWGPYKGNSVVVREEIECSPCGRSSCPEPKCVELITADEVTAAALKLLEGRKAKE